MYKVAYERRDGTVRNFTGVIGVQAAAEAVDLTFYDGSALLIRFDLGEMLLREELTDEEILNGCDLNFAAWFLEKQKAFLEQEQGGV